MLKRPNCNQISFSHRDDLRAHILSGVPTLYYGSQTSTVLPFDQLRVNLPALESKDFYFADLSSLPKEMKLIGEDVLEIFGPVTWEEVRGFCHENGLDILVAPTDETATVLAGLATSCTGERSFGFGTLREQVVECAYLNNQGETVILKKEVNLSGNGLCSDDEANCLMNYQRESKRYESFKNGPFPRLKSEIDLMIGTEGQLGVLVSAKLKVGKKEETTFLFIRLPKWEEDFSLHFKIYEASQSLRGEVRCCELLDANSWHFLDDDNIFWKGNDIIFLEMPVTEVEKVFEYLIRQVPELDPESIFEVPSSKCHELRVSIPRTINERNARAGVTKKGTDIQMVGASFKDLLIKYRELSKMGIRYNLFGHFGDGHLHFNFLPKKNEVDLCHHALLKLYSWVKEHQGSPFAEHGIGLVKRPYIQEFYGDTQLKTFKLLKRKLDPQNIFFPYGFMSPLESTIEVN